MSATSPCVRPPSVARAGTYDPSILEGQMLGQLVLAQVCSGSVVLSPVVAPKMSM
jgi:hypothetical protein